MGLLWWFSSKESTWNARDAGDAYTIPASGRFLGGRNGNPLQYSCLENPIDRSLVGYSPWSHRRVRQDLATKQQHNTYVMLYIPYIYLVLKYQIILAASSVAPATPETGFLKNSLWLDIYLKQWCCSRQTLPISWTDNGWDPLSLLPNACVLLELCTPSWLPHVRTQKSWVYLEQG